MGLDISFSRKKHIRCPDCDKVVYTETIDCEDSGGRAWYDVLEHIGYYVPYEQRTEENDWYGKDMTLSEEQATAIYDFVINNEVFNGRAIANLIALARFENDVVVINADW